VPAGAAVTGPSPGPRPASPLLRDLGLIDAALLATVQGVLSRELAASGPADRTLARLAAERLLSVAETLAGLIARPDEPAVPLEAAA
jgi:hypothetical protein